MLRGPYRVGPWPGLTPTGALILLGCAVLLAAVAETGVGSPRRALPDLPILAVSSLVPMLLGTRIVRAPGAASAICGAYLMPRTLISLVEPRLEPPPLLLVPALAFDLALWARAADLARIANAWPRREQMWRKRPRPRRSLEWWRAAFAGGAYGLVLSAVEPPFAILYGAEPSNWIPADVGLAGCLAVVGCGLVALSLSARGTAS